MIPNRYRRNICNSHPDRSVYNPPADRTIRRIDSTAREIRRTITEIVNKLIKLGVVEKAQCVRDKRIYYIKLTEKGRNIARLPYLAEQKVVDIIVRSLRDDEIETFIKIIRKL
jgi:DNA-binding MarR family transcriptional regulator